MLEEITELDKKFNPDSLTYRYKGPTVDAKCYESVNALDLLDKIKEDKIRLANVKNDQMEIKLDLGEIKKRSKKTKNTKREKKTIHNID